MKEEVATIQDKYRLRKGVKTIDEKHLEKLSHRDQVAFALFCAKQVYHLIKKPTSKRKVKACVKVVERWFEGRATEEECWEVADAAYSAADTVANSAATAAAYDTYAAAYATYAAAYATYAAAYASNAAATYATCAASYAAYAAAVQREERAAVEAQWKYYRELLEADRALLGEQV